MKRSAFAVGAFVLGAVFLAVAAIIGVGRASLWHELTRAEVYFEGSVRGLYVGAPVTFRGVQIGQVESIGIQVDDRTLAARIPVILLLDPRALRFDDGRERRDIRSLVQQGLRARLGLQSFVTNQALVDLDFKPGSPARLLGPPQAPEIPVTRDRIDAFIEQVTDLPLRETAAELRQTLAALQEALKAATRTVDVLGREAQSTSAQARATLATVQQTLQAVQGNAQGALAAVEKLADATRGSVTQLQPEMQRTLVSAREAADSARLAMQQVAQLAAADGPVRADFDSAVRDLSQAARSLKDLSETLDDRPEALIFGKEQP